MNKKFQIFKLAIFGSIILFSVGATSAQAMMFTQIPFEFEFFAEGDLTDFDSADDSNFGSVPLGFSVTIGGDSYDHFDMDSNGYVQLLSGSQAPTLFGYGGIDSLTSADPSSTYLLAGYDDLISEGGYHGYRLFSDRAVFYYNTETLSDIGEDCDDDDDGEEECEEVFGDFLNNFEMILASDGSVQWNFDTSDFDSYDYDLYSGLYFGNTGTSHELYREFLPAEESWVFAAQSGGDESTNAVPEPATMLLFGSGMIGAFIRKKFKA